MKKSIIAIIVIVLVILGIYFLTKKSDNVPVVNETPTTQTTEEQVAPVATVPVQGPESVLGKSGSGHDIKAFHFGTGEDELLFVAGIHGGYEWNTVLLGWQLVDYLKENPSAVPENIKVTVVPVLNPDGLFKTVGSADRFEASDVPLQSATLAAGRFNLNNVDLNRNFDCDWQPTGTWQSKTVSGGTAAFSEPETLALKNYVESNGPKAVVAFYSAAGGVFASDCHKGVSAETTKILKLYADASKYRAYEDFDFYEITGDMVNWLAKINIPAISVLLTNHTDTEWTKNWAGIQALIKNYAN